MLPSLPQRIFELNIMYSAAQSGYPQAGAPAWAIGLQNSINNIATTIAQNEMRNTARTQNRFSYQQDLQQAALTPLPAVRNRKSQKQLYNPFT